MPTKYDEKIKKPFSENEFSEDQIKELLNCINDINHFYKYVYIIHPDKGKIIFEPRDYQIEMIDMIHNNRFSIILASRQSGKTVNVSIYSLWYSIFNEDKIIGIVSNKESSAKKILKSIKNMYEMLPNWMKPGVTEYNKTSISFDNGTSIIVSATSSDALRGNTINLLIMDEFAFVPNNQAKEFWESNYPTISASEEAKVVIISTPNGIKNLFHDIYSKAEKNRNRFKHMKISWERVPGRDNEWAKEQEDNIGKISFRQEFAVEFLGSIRTVIEPETLEAMDSWDIKPIHIDMDDKFFIFESPQYNNQYILGVDVGKGTGNDYSVIQVLKLNNLNPVELEQVAIFRDNYTDVYQFSRIVNRISIYYNDAYIMVENNAEGSSVVNELWWNYENENLINSGTKKIDLGVRSTRSTKPRAVLLLKKLLEERRLKIYDRHTIDELQSFVEENGKFFGKNLNDDTVSSLYWGCYILEMNIFDDKILTSKKTKEEEEEVWGILSDIQERKEDWTWIK